MKNFYSVCYISLFQLVDKLNTDEDISDVQLDYEEVRQSWIIQ